MPKDVKPATTFEEQLAILMGRGLIVENREKALEILSRLNYYSFSGYLHDFKRDGGRFIHGLSFDKVWNIYKFDQRFRNILLYIIEAVENNIKTKMAYNFSHEYGPLAYLDASIFKIESEHEMFCKKLTKSIHNNIKVPFVKHHLNHYDGQFPFWVAVNLFTFGMLYSFFKNMPTKMQRVIAREFNTGPQQLISWLENMTYTRNLVAHYMRIYNFMLQKTPMKCTNHILLQEPTHKIFDQVGIMKFLYPDKEDWNFYFLSNMSSLILEYSPYVDLSCIGFPENWENVLRIN